MKRSTIALILAFVSTALFAAPGLAQTQQGPPDAAPDSVRRAAAAQFQQDHGAAWQIQWSAETGTPATLMSGTAAGYSGPPEQAGRAFLEDHAQLFGIENAQTNLRVARQNASQSGSAQVLYQQVYRGVPVLASGYLVAVNEAGEVYYVSGDYYPDVKLPSVAPQVSAQAVVRHMRDDLDAAGPSSEFEVLEQPELVVYVDKGNAGTGPDAGSAGESLSYHLAYVAEAERRSPLEAYKYVIDAQSGTVLYKTSLVEDAGHAHGFGGETPATDAGDARPRRNAAGNAALVNASGEVYRTNPLHGSPVTVTLTRLRDLSPRDLYGYEVDVNDRFGNAALSPSGEFDYSPSDFRFDQVMVYHHSNDFEAWLVGDLGWSDDTGEVNAETRSDQCYACTIPSQEDAFYSDGTGYPNVIPGFENPTHEASIMAHEQMHIVSEKYDDLNHNGDGDALDEGYSDYFAVAYRIDRQSGQSTVVGEYAFGSTTADRNVDNNYDDRNADNDGWGGNNFYDESLVFSGALWDFTTDVATDVEEAATITLGSLGHLDADPSFLDARNALIAAARDADKSNYECGIKQAFADHGIGTALGVEVYGPTARISGESGTWYASAECARSSVSYKWYKRPQGTPPSHNFYIGSGSQITVAFQESVILSAKGTSGGETAWGEISVYVGGGGGCNAATGNPPEPCLVSSPGEALPEAFALEESYPNPVRSEAQIRYALPEAAHVELSVYDALGREVARLADGEKPAGYHTATFEAGGLPSGVYVYRLRAGDAFAESGKLVVVK